MWDNNQNNLHKLLTIILWFLLKKKFWQLKDWVGQVFFLVSCLKGQAKKNVNVEACLLDFYSASSLKQQLAVIHFLSPHSKHILIPSHSVFALSPECCEFRREATNTNIIVFGLTRSGLEPAIYRIRGEQANHFTSDVVL